MSFEIIEYKIKIKVLSGLYIGGGDASTRIGGVDNEFIKHPINRMPYIPGSSIKGKLRNLLEYKAGILPLRSKTSKDDKIDGSVLSLKDYNKSSGEQKEQIKNILMLFGISGSDINKDIDFNPVTRLSFSDLELTEDFKNKFNEDSNNIYETKAETSINRSTGTAKNSSLRFTERVGAGVDFIGTISMKRFDGDSKSLELILFDGLKLLQLDALGGSSSRGYGRVKIFINDKEI